MLGILAALTPDGEADQVSWFAQSVALASKGRQMETLWRAHINLAMTLEQRADGLTQSVIDHARAAFEILDESLDAYPQPDLSARFGLVALPLAQVTRVLVATGFEDADAVLQRYPALVRCFTDASLRERAARACSISAVSVQAPVRSASPTILKFSSPRPGGPPP